MNRFLKSAVGIISAAAIAVLAGCGSDTSWAFRSSGSEVTSGMYIGLSMDALQSAYEQEGVDHQKDVFKQEIAGKDGLDWVVDKTEELALQYLAVEEQFAARELALPEDADEEAAYYWSFAASMYEDQGCGEQSFKKLVLNTKKQEMLFKNVYGKGGEKEVPESELRDIYKKEYVHADYIAVPLIDENRAPLEGEKLEQSKKDAEGLLRRIKNGEDIETVKNQYFEADNNAVPVESSSDYIRKDSGYPEKLTEALFAAKDGDADMVEDASFIYVWKKLPLDDEGFEKVSGGILNRMKGEEFNELLNQWSTELETTRNDPSIKKHSPKNLK